MKLENVLISTTSTETVTTIVEENTICLEGDGWSIAITREGLVTEAVVSREDQESRTLTLKTPSIREVRNKIKQVGRGGLTAFEKSVLLPQLQ